MPILFNLLIISVAVVVVVIFVVVVIVVVDDNVLTVKLVDPQRKRIHLKNPKRLRSQNFFLRIWSRGAVAAVVRVAPLER